MDRFGNLWLVYERMAPRGRLPERPCLIFESFCVIRRVWSVPPDWRRLDAQQLERTSWML